MILFDRFKKLLSSSKLNEVEVTPFNEIDIDFLNNKEMDFDVKVSKYGLKSDVCKKLAVTITDVISKFDYPNLNKIIHIAHSNDLLFSYKNVYNVMDEVVIDYIVLSQLLLEDNSYFEYKVINDNKDYKKSLNDKSLYTAEYNFLAKLLSEKKISFNVDVHDNNIMHLYMHKVAAKTKRYIEFSRFFDNGLQLQANSDGLTPFGLYLEKRTAMIKDQSAYILAMPPVKFDNIDEYKAEWNILCSLWGGLVNMVIHTAKTHPTLVIVDRDMSDKFRDDNSLAKILLEDGVQDCFVVLSRHLSKVYQDTSEFINKVDVELLAPLEKILLDTEKTVNNIKKEVRKV